MPAFAVLIVAGLHEPLSAEPLTGFVAVIAGRLALAFLQYVASAKLNDTGLTTSTLTDLSSETHEPPPLR